MNETQPSISVIVPSLGRDACLVQTLECLAKQQYDDFDCIVVCQGDLSETQLEKIWSIQSLRLRLFYSSEPNASLARNIGIIESQADIVLFLDDDVIIDSPTFLAEHARPYQQRRWPGVAGQVLTTEKVERSHRHWVNNFDPVAWLFFPVNFDKNCMLRSAGSGNLSVIREYAISVGGMDANYVRGAHREESDFCYRLTAKFGMLRFEPRASLVHIGEPTGGVRSWGQNVGVHPLHHVAGEWYFIRNQSRLGNLHLLEWPFHILELVRRQILNRPNLRSFQDLGAALKRSKEGFDLATRWLEAGPRLIDSVVEGSYHAIVKP